MNSDEKQAVGDLAQEEEMKIREIVTSLPDDRFAKILNLFTSENAKKKLAMADLAQAMKHDAERIVELERKLGELVCASKTVCEIVRRELECDAVDVDVPYDAKEREGFDAALDALAHSDEMKELTDSIDNAEEALRK